MAACMTRFLAINFSNDPRQRLGEWRVVRELERHASRIFRT